MIFIYSAIYSAEKDNHPIPSFFEEITGQPSPSSGMSRAFSEMIRGNFLGAMDYNRDAPMIFAFFCIQFFQRLGISLVLIRKPNPKRIRKHLLPADVIVSVILFLLCFVGQIKALFQVFFS